ncbi:phage tail protein [Aquimarina brevivitae]|uniref:Microcystin-dependent protein n=1 Tax=Aquimarina brevivitae TaxID=323412 RepID=A0A4Q7PJ49_9FLAO|nr:tail fiber protein [Aquimarina brevivitae]RZS98942.1 microcystin-dependent protein [Aquimarina brevivitae]
MEGYIGEVRMFGGNFAPRAWAFCEGQLLPISNNTALFSIIGTVYGGDGRTTFALPDLRGCVPIGPGRGPGLSDRIIGQRGGSEENTLNVTQIPSHNHAAVTNVSSAEASQSAATQGSSIGTPGALDGRSFSPTLGFNTSTPDVSLNAQSITVGNTGGNLPVENMQPWLSCYYIICLQGIFPSRN